MIESVIEHHGTVEQSDHSLTSICSPSQGEGRAAAPFATAPTKIQMFSSWVRSYNPPRRSVPGTISADGTQSRHLLVNAHSANNHAPRPSSSGKVTNQTGSLRAVRRVRSPRCSRPCPQVLPAEATRSPIGRPNKRQCRGNVDVLSFRVNASGRSRLHASSVELEIGPGRRRYGFAALKPQRHAASLTCRDRTDSRPPVSATPAP